MFFFKSVGEAAGLTVIKLVMPLTPQRPRTAFSASRRWYCHSTSPLRVTQPFHCHVNLVDGNRRIPVECVDDRRSDIGVGPFCPDQAHFNIVGNRRYSVDAKGSLFGPPFFHKGIHISSQRDDAILDGDADFTKYPPAKPGDTYQRCEG